MIAISKLSNNLKIRIIEIDSDIVHYTILGDVGQYPFSMSTNTFNRLYEVIA